MCDEVIFLGRYLHTIGDLRKALDGGQSGYHPGEWLRVEVEKPA